MYLSPRAASGLPEAARRLRRLPVGDLRQNDNQSELGSYGTQTWKRVAVGGRCPQKFKQDSHALYVCTLFCTHFLNMLG